MTSGPSMTFGRGAVVIGVGNEFRRDDGVGPALIARLADAAPPGTTCVISDGEPTGLIEAWDGADLVVVVDAVVCEPPQPGRIHRTTADSPLLAAHSASTHGLGVPEAVRLAEVLGRAPKQLVVFAVEAAEIGHGHELSEQVERALPELLEAVLAELSDHGPVAATYRHLST